MIKPGMAKSEATRAFDLKPDCVYYISSSSPNSVHLTLKGNTTRYSAKRFMLATTLTELEKMIWSDNETP